MMRVAVVGSGISGLAVAWLLRSQHEIHLFERDARLGGHAYSFEVERDGRTLSLDLGFLVYNQVTHPNLMKLFDILGVETQPCDMSFGFHCAGCGLEYGGFSLQGLLAQPTNALRPSFLRLLSDLVRFNAAGQQIVAAGRDTGGNLGELVRAGGYSPEFVRHFLAPLAAAIWFSGTGDILSFPTYPLLRGLSNHGLLGLQSQLAWRTLTGGSHSYVQAMELGLGDCLHPGTPVVRVERGEHEVGLCFADHGRDTFDAVILATHADEALALLADPSDGERELLGTWRYTNHEAVLHTDLRLLPRRRATRAPRSCWLSDCKRPAERVSVSYYLNRLQSLDATEPYIVTLNPVQPPAAGRVVHRVWMRRPVYTSGSLAAQKALAGLQGTSRTYYCGAYLGWGCHEDGLVSALQVAEQLGVRRW